jgi:tetratricopeptide (TPR) repeat protein
MLINNDQPIMFRSGRNNSVAFHNRGFAKALLQDYEGAIADYTKAIKVDPNYSEAYHNRGILSIRLGQSEDGCLDVRKASELGYQLAHEMLGKYWE